jgi:hypothetical protein
MKVKFICKICHQVGEIELQSSGDPTWDKFLAKLAEGGNHDRCIPEPVTKLKAKRQLALPTEARVPYSD